MSTMFSTLKNAFRIEDLRKKIFFTLICVLIYRLGAAVPIPGISPVAFSNLLSRFGQLGQFLQIISGTGDFKAVSIFSLGIAPYINASIIMQLLTVAIPALEEMSKEGESGRKRIQRITRYVTIGIAFMMSFAYWYSTRLAAESILPTWLNALLVISAFTAGSAFIMWLGEQINEKGIGNGISIIIFIGIISRLPSMLTALHYTFKQWQDSKNSFIALLGVLFVIAIFVAVIFMVVFIQSSERRINVNYSKRVVGRKMYGGQSTYLPLKLNQGGVLPVIFAVSIMMMPSTIVSLFKADGPVAQWFLNLNQSILYYVIYSLLIFGFTFFYSGITFNPLEIANNLRKNGGKIPGYREGRPTVNYIQNVARALCWFEALFLVFIVMFPMVLSALTNTIGSLWFGGTAVLIVVGVAMDMVNQLEAQMMMRHYKGFLD